MSEFLGALQVPSYAGDQRIRDVAPGQKRGIQTADDFADSLLASVSGKRFRGSGLAQPLRNALPDAFARGLNVVNTGFSTTDAQTDEVITQCVFARPYAQGWERNFIEQSPLFASATEPIFGMNEVYTVADPPVMNYLLELGDLTDKAQAFAPRAGIGAELDMQSRRFKHLIPRSAEEWAVMWSFLGPMTTVEDGSVPYGGSSLTNHIAGTERLLGYSVYNRALTFNLFGTRLRRGDQLYYDCKEVDLSKSRNFVDPAGNAVVARTSYHPRALQVIGYTDSQAPFPVGNTSYDDADARPREADLDYVRRAHRMAQEYRPMVWREDETLPEGGELAYRRLDEDAANPDNAPAIIFDAYMIGEAKKVGTARHFLGRAPTDAQIAEGLRSQSAMMQLQTVEIYRGI